MLLLTRRPQDTIVFPALGITIEVASIQGKMVRLGIDAPREIAVLRGELSPHPKGDRTARNTQHLSEHAVRNLLNRSHLAFHLAQKQLAAGQEEAAARTLQKALCELEKLEGLAADNSPPQALERGPRALLVDDDLNEGELLAGILRMNGFVVELASDGYEALESLSAGATPDLVLLDMLMPRCDGADTIRAIRAQPKWAGLKVFAISGASPASLGVVTGPSGCDRWFPKPVRPEVLMRELQRELRVESQDLSAAC